MHVWICYGYLIVIGEGYMYVLLYRLHILYLSNIYVSKHIICCVELCCVAFYSPCRIIIVPWI